MSHLLVGDHRSWESGAAGSDTTSGADTSAPSRTGRDGHRLQLLPQGRPVERDRLLPEALERHLAPHAPQDVIQPLIGCRIVPRTVQFPGVGVVLCACRPRPPFSLEPASLNTY